MSKIVVCHCNRPDFLSLQIESFFHLCKDLEEIIVFNDGSSLELRQQIKNICSDKKNVKCIDVPLDIDHSSAPVACSAVLQWAYDNVANKENGMFGFFDSDMFPISEFKISDYLSNEISFSGLKQIRGDVDYIWNGIFFIDFDKLAQHKTLNWNCGVVKCENVDCGGLTHLYFQKHGRHGLKYLTHTGHMTKSQLNSLKQCPKTICDQYDNNFRMEVIEEVFLHYGSASNWQTKWLSPLDFNSEKTNFLIKWLKSVGSIQ